MSEHKLISAQDPDEPATCAWPVWEVQGYGTVTGPGEGQDGAMRCEIRPPWLDVRLTFADGAKLDVLAVVRDGRIAIEDAQADPPLALDGFAALAGVIQAPLEDACEAFTGRPRGPAAGQAAELVVEQVIPVEGILGEAISIEAVGSGEPVAAKGESPATGVSAPEGEHSAGGGSAADVDTQAAEASSGRHRARFAPSRGSAGRRGAAEAYRAAQREGRDPVLAVMAATGLSRRKSLRLIAGARDEGHLSPRHHRR